MVDLARFDEMDGYRARHSEDADQVENPDITEILSERAGKTCGYKVAAMVENLIAADARVEQAMTDKSKTERRNSWRNYCRRRAEHRLDRDHKRKYRKKCDEKTTHSDQETRSDYQETLDLETIDEEAGGNLTDSRCNSGRDHGHADIAWLPMLSPLEKRRKIGPDTTADVGQEKVDPVEASQRATRGVPLLGIFFEIRYGLIILGVLQSAAPDARLK